MLAHVLCGRDHEDDSLTHKALDVFDLRESAVRFLCANEDSSSSALSVREVFEQKRECVQFLELLVEFLNQTLLRTEGGGDLQAKLREGMRRRVS